MSLHRYAPKRDTNEPAIRARFKVHGWHTEAVSQKGMPDLIVVDLNDRRRTEFVDVKDGKGQPTKDQVKKWAELHALGIPVYVVRSEADVDELVAGELLPWAPWGAEVRSMEREDKRGDIRAPRPHGDDRRLPQPSTVKGERKLGTNSGMKRSRCGKNGCTRLRPCITHDSAYTGKLPLASSYISPRAKPVDAAKEAEAFAPPPKRLPCLDPDKMNGAGDQFPGSDYD